MRARADNLSGRILEAAGFAGVTPTDVHEPVCYGPDVSSVGSMPDTRPTIIDFRAAGMLLRRIRR